MGEKKQCDRKKRNPSYGLLTVCVLVNDKYNASIFGLLHLGGIDSGSMYVLVGCN